MHPCIHPEILKHSQREREREREGKKESERERESDARDRGATLGRSPGERKSERARKGMRWNEPAQTQMNVRVLRCPWVLWQIRGTLASLIVDRACHPRFEGIIAVGLDG